ncbi:CVNH domain-containing protein [Camillea tinctor]|nr:CVNH domain-containing protein [Camillea tinctor]
MVRLTAIVAFSSSFAGALAAPSTSPVPGNQDSFENTCTRWKIYQQDGGVWIAGYCRDGDGQLWHSVLNLDHCIANDSGQLTGRAEGGFSSSCSDLQLESDTSLNAQCAGGDGSRGSIKLSDIISNDNGELYCFGIRGCAMDATGCNDKPSGIWD